MKHNFLLVLSICVLLIGCTEKKDTKILHHSISSDAPVLIPKTTIAKSALVYNNKTSVWTLKGQVYSGYALSFHQDSTLKEKMGILNGKKENQSTQWFPDGQVRLTANYHNGKLDGPKKAWSSDSNHILISQLNYKLGRPHGEQKKWYHTGELHKILNLNMGKEEGMQQAFRENGALYANYEAKNGRIFGLQKASLCYGLEEETIEYDR